MAAEHYFSRFCAAILDRPRLWASALVFALGLALVGALDTRIDFSSESFYANDPAAAAELQDFRSQWGHDDDEVIVFVDGGRPQALLSEAAWTELQALVIELRATPGVRGVEDPLSVLEQRRDGPSVAKWTQTPPIMPLLIDAEARRCALVVELSGSSDAILDLLPTIEALEAHLAQARGGQLRLEMAGIPAIRAAFVRLTLSDQLRLVPATALVIALGLFWVFRSLHAVAIAGLAAAYPVLCLLGVMGWKGEAVGLLNQSYFTILPVMAVADAIHWLVRYREQSARVWQAAGCPSFGAELRRRAVIETSAHMGVSCLLTSVTTACGFWALCLSDLSILSRFGSFAGWGMVIGYASSLIMIPLLLDRFGAGPSLSKGQASRLMRGCSRVASRRGWALLSVGLVVTLLSWAAARRVAVDNSLLDLLEREHPVHAASLEVDAHLGGVFALELTFTGETRLQETEPHVDQLPALLEWLEQQEGVRVVLGPAWLRQPLDPPALDGGPFEADFGRTLWMSVRLEDRGGTRFEAFAERVAAQLRAFDWPKGTAWHMTGSSQLAYRGVNRITHELRGSLGLVFSIVSLLIAILFRSLRVALLSVWPNALPLLVGVAALWVFGWHMDPLAAVVLSMALGIAVDDTIHLLVRVREESRVLGPEAAIEAALVGSGRAIVVTSLLLSVGLGLNLGSSFPPLQQLGCLGATVMLAALVADLLLLPALWRLFGPRGSQAAQGGFLGGDTNAQEHEEVQ